MSKIFDKIKEQQDKTEKDMIELKKKIEQLEQKLSDKSTPEVGKGGK